MENQTIEKIDFTTTALQQEYSECRFESCDFSQTTIENVYFEQCTFTQCNFSLTKFCNILRDVKFIGCKMTGADFSQVSKFALCFSFDQCQMTYASFVEVKAKATAFTSCDLSEAYFDNANFEAAAFDRSNLTRTSFARTNLRKADFSTAQNFCIDPTNCDLRGATFSQSDLRGLVAHLGIKILEI